MPRKGENIYKRKDGRWEGRFIKSYKEGKALYGYIYGKSYKEAKTKLLQKRSMLREKGYDETNLVFSFYAKCWLIEKESTIKNSTYAKYSNLLNSYILPAIGNKLVSQLSYEQLSNFCATLLNSGGKNSTGLSPKITSDCLTIIKAIIKYAARKNCNIDLSSYDVCIKLKSRPLRVLTIREQESLLGFLRASPTPINIGIINQLLVQPQNNGQYTAEVQYLALTDGILPNLNYNIKNVGIKSSYVIGDNPNKIIGTNVTVGTINNSSFPGIAISAPTKAQMDILFTDKLANPKLKKAYEDGKDINLYLVCSDVSAERISNMRFPADYYQLIDVKLYACIKNETTRYEITETTADINFAVTLTAEQMKSIGYNDTRNLYVTRFHGGNKDCDFESLVVPYSLDDNATFTVGLKSSKFSEFCFYTKEMISLEDLGLHIVPNTQA